MQSIERKYEQLIFVLRLINYIYQQLTAVLFDSTRSVCTLDQHIFSADRESPVCRLGQPPGGAR